MSDCSWAIFGIVLVALMFSPLFIEQYTNGQCRIEAIKAGVEADKIKMACGIK